VITNEYAFFISLDGRVMVVADGLGGHAAGEVASALAIEAVRATFLDAGEIRNVADIAKALQVAVAQADARIRAHVVANPACKGMATTLLIGVVRDACLALAHVGDVRAYCCNADGLARLTEDHSVVAQCSVVEIDRSGNSI
jgi:protein phosphatase